MADSKLAEAYTGGTPTVIPPSQSTAEQPHSSDSYVQDSYGSNATEALQKGMKAGQDYASEQANRSARGAGEQAVGYARASGLSPAQAALMAGQQSGSNYNQAYSSNLADATNQYGKYAESMGNLSNQRYATEKSLEGTKYAADKGYDASKANTDVTNTGNWLNAIGSGLSGLFSDENAKVEIPASSTFNDVMQQGSNSAPGTNMPKGSTAKAAMEAVGKQALQTALMAVSDRGAKTDIRDGYDILKAVTDKVPLRTFRYKEGIGEDPNVRHVGVMAQDLEKTPLSGTVYTDPESGLKKVDVGQLTAGNTAMITELSKKVDSLAKFFKEYK